MSYVGQYRSLTGGCAIEYFNVGGGVVQPDGTGGITITNGANITWTAGVATMQADVTGTTEHAVQIGNAGGSLTSLAVGTNGQVLIGATTAAPAFATITCTDNRIEFTVGANTLDIDTANSINFLSNGFNVWSGGGPYYDDTTLGQLTLQQGGLGTINAVPITFTSPQTVTGLLPNNVYLIYIDAAGVIQAAAITYANWSQIYNNRIPLFTLLYDNSTPTRRQITTYDSQLFTYGSGNYASDLATRSLVLTDWNNGARIALNGTQGIQIDGTTAEEIIDSSLREQMPTGTGLPETFYQMYIDAGGYWATHAISNTFTSVYNNAGTITALGAGTFGIYTLYVGKGNAPTFWTVINTTQYASLVAAQRAIAEHTLTNSDIASGNLYWMKLARLGYIIYSEATNSIVDVIISRNRLREEWGDISSQDATLNYTTTTNFDHILGATDLTVQQALESLDDLTFAGDAGTAQANAVTHRFTFAGGTGITSAAAGSVVSMNLDTPIAVTDGGTGLNAIATGQIIYGSAANTYTALAFDATATRYLANTGGGATIPAWDQINLTNGVTGTLPVGNGGLGVADPTDHCVLVGSGNTAVTPITAGVTGELLCGVTGADPDFAASSDGDFSFTSATAAVQRTLTVSNTDNTAALSPANVQVTVGGDTNTGDPYINFLVSASDTYSVGIDNSVAGNPLKITSGASPSAGTDLFTMTSAGVITLNNDLDVSEGGTGVSTLTLHGVLLGNAAADIQATAEGATNQALLGNTGANPTWGAVPNAALANSTITVTGGSNITVAGSPVSLGGAVTIASTGGVTWGIVTADTNPMVVYTGYICNKAGLLTLTLPVTAVVGTVMRVTGMNTDVGWRVAQNANQQIHVGNISTTAGAGGYIESTHKRDSVELVCVVANLEWNCTSMMGNVTIA